MTDGIYIFNNCVTTGRLSFGAVTDGDTINREWNLTCNDPPDLQSFLDNGELDPSTISRYYDAVLVVDGVEVADMAEWEPSFNFDTKEWRKGGSKQKWDLDMGHKVTLTIRQVVVRDTLFRKVALSTLPGAAPASLSVQCHYRGR